MSVFDIVGIYWAYMRAIGEECSPDSLSSPASSAYALYMETVSLYPHQLTASNSPRLGKVPIMICSDNCHLANMTQRQLVQAGEEPLEFGGQFMVGGLDKVLRLIIQQVSSLVGL